MPALSSSLDTIGESASRSTTVPVSFTGHHSSLVTTLCVAEKFSTSHLSSSKVAPLIENAKYFYMEGYFLTHGVPAAMGLSNKAAVAGKVPHESRFHDQLTYLP